MQFYQIRNQFMVSLVVASSLLTSHVSSQQTPGKGADSDSVEIKTEMVEIKLFDNEVMKGHVYLPSLDNDEQIQTLVIFVPGTGPATYLNKRQRGKETFNYFDYFGNELAKRGVAMFSFNKRGVTIGDEPPMFDEVDREKFRKSIPSYEIRDLAAIISRFKNDQRFAKSKVVLLGWSEGSIIAPLFAEHYPDKVDALMLAGYANEEMLDVIRYQHNGVGSMLTLNPVFDKDEDGSISSDEYESAELRPKRYREKALQNTPFNFLDADQDGLLTAKDFGQRLQMRYKLLTHNIKQRNEDWIWNHYFRITPEWFDEHFQLEPNKTRIPRLKLPIYIFHGTNDANLPADGVRDLKSRFELLGKSNLKTNIFDDHDHDLNFSEWVRDNKMSKGIQQMVEVAESLAKTEAAGVGKLESEVDN